MKDLLVHPVTLQQLQHTIASPPHAILLNGKAGSGKATIGQNLSAKLLKISPEKLENHPYYICINPEASVITIDEIRELQQFLKLRVPTHKHSKIQRIVTIIQAERMRTEAQNALLKTLEEPPSGTMILLTSDHPEKLLPTISSRTQTIHILPVAEEQAQKYFAGIPPTDFKRAYALSGGQAGLLYALLHNQDHPLITQVELAKNLLAKTPAERLVQVDVLSKDKFAVQQLLDAFLRLTHAGLRAAATKQAANVRAWNQRHQTVLDSIEYLQKNANAKLVLDNLFLNI